MNGCYTPILEMRKMTLRQMQQITRGPQRQKVTIRTRALRYLVVTSP